MPPWPIEVWSRMITSGNCRKERGTWAMRGSGSFAAQATNAPQMMRHLELMQQEIRALQPRFDNRRFRFDNPEESSSSTRLQNGALLTFTQDVNAAQQPNALADAQAHGLADAPGGAVAAVSEAPAQRRRVSVEEVSKRILEGAVERECGADEAEEADAKATAKATAKAKAKAKAKPKAKPKAKDRARPCPIRCQDDGRAKKFRCYWHKLNCKSFAYVSEKDKKRAQRLAEEWLQAKGAKHGCKAPPITL